MAQTGDSSTEPEQGAYRIRERLDYEQWVFEHLLEMTRVQSIVDPETYENMLNTLILTLHPYWPDGFEERWQKARAKWHPDKSNPINRERVEDKEILKAELIDKMEIGFTRKRHLNISGGMEPLFKLFPPFPQSKEPSSKS